MWFAGPERRVKWAVPAHDLTGMPAVLPTLSDHQYQLPELVGRTYDSVILTGDALCSLEDAWCKYASRSLFRAGAVMRPLRVLLRLPAQLLGLPVTWTMTVTARPHRSCVHDAKAVGSAPPTATFALCSVRLTPSPNCLAWFSIG